MIVVGPFILFELVQLSLDVKPIEQGRALKTRQIVLGLLKNKSDPFLLQTLPAREVDCAESHSTIRVYYLLTSAAHYRIRIYAIIHENTVYPLRSYRR